MNWGCCTGRLVAYGPGRGAPCPRWASVARDRHRRPLCIRQGGGDMPISERIDHERRWGETTIEGPVTFADFESHWHRELAAQGESYPELIDGRSAEVAFDAHDVRRMVEVLRLAAASRPLGPTAILVHTDVGFGMVRMLSL